MDKYLVSGSSGFLASNLKVKGEIVPIDRSFLTNPILLKELFTQEKPDYILHFGAYGNMSNQTDEMQIFETNVLGTFMMLNACRDIKIKGFINVGSSSEYGRKVKPMSESDVPETDTFYGASKVAGTYLSRAFATKYDKPIVTIRPFSIYGPKEADFRFIPTSTRCVVKNEYMKLVDGFHDWTYIEDFADGLNVVIKNIDKLKGKVVNIGTGVQTSNVDIVKKLASFAGKKFNDLNMVYEQDMSQAISNWVADTKALTSLGWSPRYTLSEGLKKTFDYYA